jgi:hypothetical protein
MDLPALREWLLTLSGSATLLSLALSVWLGVQQYRLKLKAEERLARSTQAETDLRLLNAFVALIQDAASTGRYEVSETLIRFLIDSGHLSAADLKDPVAYRQKIADGATVAVTVGLTHSRMACLAIGVLARRYEFLRELGILALESKRIAENDPDVVQMMLADLKKK